MPELCTTCLSQDRMLKPLDKDMFGLFDVIFDDKKVFMKEMTVCWECTAIFQKLYNFKLQVLRAQEMLNYNKPQQTLSHLKCYNSAIIDVCCETDEPIQDTKPDIPDFKMKTDDNDYLAIDSIKSENNSIDDTENELQRVTIENNGSFESIQIKLVDSITNKTTIKQERGYKSLKSRKRLRDDTKIKKKSKKVLKEYRDVPEKVKKHSDAVIINKNGDKSILTKENYTIIYMDDEELNARKLLNKQSEKFRERCRYKCEYCLSYFLDEIRYERHMKTKHTEAAGKHECHICKVRFMKINHFKEHVASHYRKYLCQCGYVGYSLKEMALHDGAEHGIKRFACGACGKEFPSRAGLKYHRITAHVDPIKCGTCGKSFKAKKFLTIHMMKIHSSKPMSECHICGAKRKHMAAHMLKHQAKPEAAYCAECDQRFASIAVYKNHLRFAAKHRPPETLKYSCSYCQYKFVNSTLLRKHIMIVHCKEQLPFKCGQCDKRFEAECRVRAHVLRDHEGVLPPKDKICHICGRGFSIKSTLANHIRVHTGEKPFRCLLCDAAFSQKSSLTTHTRGVHLKMKTRPCRANRTDRASQSQ